MHIILGALTLAVMVGALADIITRDEWQVKHLPKFVWIILVILLPLVGSVLWFAVGREYGRPVDLGGFGDPRRWDRSSSSPTSATQGSAMSQTERELERLEREIAQAEQEERIRRLERELDERRARE